MAGHRFALPVQDHQPCRQIMKHRKSAWPALIRLMVQHHHRAGQRQSQFQHEKAGMDHPGLAVIISTRRYRPQGPVNQARVGKGNPFSVVGDVFATIVCAPHYRAAMASPRDRLGCVGLSGNALPLSAGSLPDSGQGQTVCVGWLVMPKSPPLSAPLYDTSDLPEPKVSPRNRFLPRDCC